MELYLMQHGQAVAELEDPARPLSREGVEQMQLSARALSRLGLAFDVIICSPKRRAHQSAALVAEAVRYPYSDILESDTALPQAEPELMLKKLAQLIGDKILVVGHLPNLGRVASSLLGCRQEAVRFENGGLVCIVRSGELPQVSQVVTAEQMRMIGRG